MGVWNWLNEQITRIFCLPKGAECTVQSCLWEDRWQLLCPEACRTFFNWDRWHDSTHLEPFPVIGGIKRINKYKSSWQKWIKLFNYIRIPSSSVHKTCADREEKDFVASESESPTLEKIIQKSINKVILFTILRKNRFSRYLSTCHCKK